MTEDSAAMVQRRSRVASWAVLGFLLMLQFAVLLRVPWPRALVGDEPYYVERARQLRSSGFRSFGTPSVEDQWRPPGYAVVVAASGYASSDVISLRKTTGIAQFVLMALALLFLHGSVTRTFRGAVPVFSALLLGVQPWTFEFARSITPDSLAASLTTIGILLLARSAALHSFRAARLPLAGGVALLTISAFLRSELLVAVPIYSGVAILLSVRRSRHLGESAVVAGAVLIVLAGAFGLYRYQLTGRWQLVGRLSLPDAGAFAWTRTWLGTERQAYDNFVYRLTQGTATLESVPRRAFADAAERRAIELAIGMLKRDGRYSPEIDRIFASVARKRVRDNWVRSALLTRLWAAAHLWINTETNSQLLFATSRMPGWMRKPLLGGLLMLKFTVYVLATLGAWMAARRVTRGGRDRPDLMTSLMATAVLIRTVLVGIVLFWMVHRYVLNVWPAMLWCAIAGFAELWIRRENARASILRAQPRPAMRRAA